ncbi:MAG: serine hydroxymethyltransferase [Desulfovibrionaceae bacterium]|nr:serine hydroxymethyltransferase [Desulfovibrionaceae bacterium]
MEAVLSSDPILGNALISELERQITGLEMIASENFVSPAVREVQASILMHKYAEGYPQARYYNGCEIVDIVEQVAIERACTLFDAEYANVQPHSGSQANMAAYFAVAQHGDTILGMDLAHGGHLTHGSPVSFSGKWFTIVSYGLHPETGEIDYTAMEELAHKHKPRIILAGASAYPRVIDFERFRKVADAVGAVLIVDMAHIAGLVAAGMHPSPIPHADIVTTTTHKTLRGARGGMILAKKEYAKAINSAVFPMLQGGPLLHVIAGKAICLLEAQKELFRVYQRNVVDNARYLAELLQREGLNIVTGGTDNHLILIDLTSKNATGIDVANALDKAGITVNKNSIPFDTKPPSITSGIRVGTPAITTRGMKKKDMEYIAEWIIRVINNRTNDSVLATVRAEVQEFARTFPLFTW